MPASSTPGHPRLLIIGAYGMTNLGDDAILAAMLGELRDALPGATFAVVAQDLAALPNDADITRIHFNDLAIRTALDDANLLIIGSSGLLFDFRIRASYDDFFSDRATNFYPHYRAALIAHGRGIPIHLYAVGVGPLVGPVARDLTRTICDLASAITVRDRLSQIELQALGIPAARIEVTADPAVRLPVPAIRRNPGPPRVGFVIRNWFPITTPGAVQLPHASAYLERYFDTFAAAADHVAAQRDGRPIFFSVQNEVDDDRHFAERVLTRMAHRDKAMVIETAAQSSRSASTTRWPGPGGDNAAARRENVAANVGVPATGFNLNTKIRAFLTDLGLPELAVFTLERSPNGAYQ